MSYSVSPSMQLKFPEKIGYACGDMASNLYWRLFDLYLMLFYTDVFGIPAKAAGTIATVAIIFNAICDPAMGALADRTATRFGKFRPYLLWGILPIISAGELLVTVPDWSAGGKLMWAYGTYIMMMLCYSFINVPYGSLLGVITSDSRQRTTLTSFRFFGAFTGGSIVAYLLPTLVKFFGNGSERIGWQLTMLFFGILAGALFLTSFLTTRERIAPPVHQQSSPVQDLKDLMHNPPWIVLFFLALIIMITISMRATAGSYYVKYHLGRPDLLS
ncbi:MAG TPA: glycoside-pentoside-hexuronide (GPH):cation symporter, partial [Bacteroidota bacterium]|nr:glycoside-pentoside-hexuronide (GPH):cation symporter [Bacteroidota bacterium]